MVFSLAIVVFLICYILSGFSWRGGCQLFSWSFFIPLLGGLIAMCWRCLDVQTTLVFVSAKIGQSQARMSLPSTMSWLLSLTISVLNNSRIDSSTFCPLPPLTLHLPVPHSPSPTPSCPDNFPELPLAWSQWGSIPDTASQPQPQSEGSPQQLSVPMLTAGIELPLGSSFWTDLILAICRGYSVRLPSRVTIHSRPPRWPPAASRVSSLLRTNKDCTNKFAHDSQLAQAIPSHDRSPMLDIYAFGHIPSEGFSSWGIVLPLAGMQSYSCSKIQMPLPFDMLSHRVQWPMELR